MRSAPAYITSHHPTVIPISTHQHPIVGSRLFHIWNHTGIGLSYKVLQLRKTHKIEPVYNSACMEDVTPLQKAMCPRNLRNEAKMHGTLNVAEYGSLVSIQLLYERSWLHWYHSKAFIIGGNLWKTQQGRSFTQLLRRILDPRLWQCTRHQGYGKTWWRDPSSKTSKKAWRHEER